MALSQARWTRSRPALVTGGPALGYKLLADAVVGAHYAYLAYLVGGGFLAWRWPRTIRFHLIAAGWGLAVVATRWPCPLTAAQNALRERGGEPRLRDGFIETYLSGTVYPAGHDAQARAAVAAIVGASWAGLVARSRVTGSRRPTVRAATAARLASRARSRADAS